MDVQRKWIDNYTSALNKLSGQMRLNLERTLAEINPDDESVLQEVQEVMLAFCENACMKAAEMAATFYDGMHTIQTGEPFGAEPISSYVPKATAIATAGIMRDGLNESSVRQLLDRLEYEIKKSAGDCVISNALKENGEDG